jgi:hypothetical protein
VDASDTVKAGEVFSFQGKTIDFSTHELSTSQGKIQLTLMEADLLRHLIRSNGRVVSRKSILEEVWGLKEDTDTRAIDNFVVRLRRYIEDNPARPRHLLTVRGVVHPQFAAQARQAVDAADRPGSPLLCELGGVEPPRSQPVPPRHHGVEQRRGPGSS